MLHSVCCTCPLVRSETHNASAPGLGQQVSDMQVGQLTLPSSTSSGVPHEKHTLCPCPFLGSITCSINLPFQNQSTSVLAQVSWPVRKLLRD